MIYLNQLQPENVTGFYQWILDYETTKYSLSRFQKLKTKQQIDDWYQETINNTKNVNFGIYLTENNQCIGYAGFSNLSTLNRSAEYFIFIGDKNSWGKGIGTLTTQKVVAHGFEVLKLNRIMLTVSEPNIGGLKAYLKAGFKHEGILREACFREGAFHNKIVMSMLHAEYKK